MCRIIVKMFIDTEMCYQGFRRYDSFVMKGFRNLCFRLNRCHKLYNIWNITRHFHFNMISWCILAFNWLFSRLCLSICIFEGNFIDIRMLTWNIWALPFYFRNPPIPGEEPWCIGTHMFLNMYQTLPMLFTGQCVVVIMHISMLKMIPDYQP